MWGNQKWIMGASLYAFLILNIITLDSFDFMQRFLMINLSKQKFITRIKKLTADRIL